MTATRLPLLPQPTPDLHAACRITFETDHVADGEIVITWPCGHKATLYDAPLRVYL